MKASERYKLIKSMFPNLPENNEKEYILNLVNDLLHSLQIPTTETSDGYKIDYNRLDKFNIDKNEPANWADLSCSEVKIFRELIEIIIEEAAPGQCPTLCSYIENFLEFHGYKTIVRTEW